jgi:hypothetical protein
MKSGMRGSILATTVGLMFMANMAMAQDNSSAGAGGAPSARAAKVRCMGANSRKGSSSCKSAQHDVRDKTPARVRALSRLRALRNAPRKAALRQPAERIL